MEISHEKVSHKFLELNSCGRQATERYDREILRKNGRKDYHFLYITQGICYLDEQPIKEGNLIFFRPDEPQHYQFLACDKTVSLYIHFSGTGCEELLKSCHLYQRVTHIGKSSRLERIFDQLLDEYLLKKPCHADVCAGLLWQFMAVAGQKSCHRVGKAVYPEKNLDAVCRQMHREYFKNRAVAEYADMLHLSVSRFSHAFKERTGFSPKAYITRIKVDNACRLLEDPNLSLAEVARTVGVDDLNYFSRLIKKYTGHTPSFFRNLL